MNKKRISKKLAINKYGVLAKKNDGLKYYLLDNGKIIDSTESTRYDPCPTEYDKVIDALNLIDEQAEQGGGDCDEQKARAEAYEVVANFIDKKAKR